MRGVIRSKPREPLDKASDNLSVRRAFGAAYEKNGVLIIPVAMVAGRRRWGHWTYPAR